VAVEADLSYEDTDGTIQGFGHRGANVMRYCANAVWR
jgi:hypothetical protein